MYLRTQKGFTFVELVISLGVLLILLSIIIFVLNPLRQINKAFDGRRLADLSSFTSVFETYYNDNQHFPTSVPFGSIWKQGNTVYMSSTPQDPQGTNNGGYVYMTDGSASPQWAVMFSKLSNSSSSSSNSTCELTPACAPAGYTPGQWACKVYGTVSCSSLTSQSLPGTTIISQASQNNTANTNQQSSQSNGNATGTKVTLCHATGNGSYVQITTNASADVGGYDSNPNDIIPPFTYSCTTGTCNYPGKNWTTQNQATYNNKCVVTTSTPTPTPKSCLYPVGSYCMDDTKFLQTYAIVSFTYPGFDPWWMIDLSFRPDFGGTIQVGMDGMVPNPINADTVLWAETAGSGTIGLSTSPSEQAEDQLTSKYEGLVSHPYTWTQYANGCGKTIYWRITNFPTGIPGVNYTANKFSPVYSNKIDCTTKVGVVDSSLWWTNPPSDFNKDGLVNWTDYAIGVWDTKFRAGGWQPPE